MNRLIKQIPNLITLMNLASGALSLAMLLLGEPLLAAYLVCLAAVFDFLDGTAARLLRASSETGKQLDSLADIISFGVAPAALVFSFLHDQLQPVVEFFEWVLVATPILLVLAAAIRLARFNIEEGHAGIFKGLPTPASGIFFATYLICCDAGSSIMPEWTSPYLAAGLTFLMAVLMISNLPMFSLKINNMAWKGNEIKYIFVVLSLILLILMRWKAVPLCIFIYIILSAVQYITTKLKTSDT